MFWCEAAKAAGIPAERVTCHGLHVWSRGGLAAIEQNNEKGKAASHACISPEQTADSEEREEPAGSGPPRSDGENPATKLGLCRTTTEPAHNQSPVLQFCGCGKAEPTGIMQILWGTSSPVSVRWRGVIPLEEGRTLDRPRTVAAWTHVFCCLQSFSKLVFRS